MSRFQDRGFLLRISFSINNSLYLYHSFTRNYPTLYLWKKNGFKYLFVYKFIFIASSVVIRRAGAHSVRCPSWCWPTQGVRCIPTQHYTLCAIIIRRSLSLYSSLLEVSLVFTCHWQTFSRWNSLLSLCHLWSFISYISKTSSWLYITYTGLFP